MTIEVDPDFKRWWDGFGNKRWQTRNGVKISSKGYKMIHKPDHPHCNNQGYVMEHRLIMEEHLGRYLKQKEEVHHMDENKKNNDIENLLLLTSKSEHARLHHIIDRFQKQWISKYGFNHRGFTKEEIEVYLRVRDIKSTPY